LEIDSYLTANYPLAIIPAADHMKGTEASQRRGENSVMSSTMPKSQQQKDRKQQATTEIPDAEWHTLIDRLAETMKKV